jgi:hypothetical protein
MEADFLIFITDLCDEIGSQNYCTDIRVSGISTAILTLSFQFEVPLLSICGELIPEQEAPIIGMWQLLLEKEKIQEHVMTFSYYLNFEVRR